MIASRAKMKRKRLPTGGRRRRNVGPTPMAKHQQLVLLIEHPDSEPALVLPILCNRSKRRIATEAEFVKDGFYVPPALARRVLELIGKQCARDNDLLRTAALRSEEVNPRSMYETFKKVCPKP
jgi:hypothetical protein